MGINMYIFDSQSIFHRYPQGGIMCGQEIELKIYVKRGSFLMPRIRLDKRKNYDSYFFHEITMNWISLEKNYDLYTATFTINEEGNYFYSFILEENSANKGLLFNEQNKQAVSSQKYQLLIYNKDYITPKWTHGGIIYHIFVDRFYKHNYNDKSYKLENFDVESHKIKNNNIENLDVQNNNIKNNDIIIRNDWYGTPNYLPDENGEIKNNDFFGGNLKGIIEKLPYLSELGITILYLSPIFKAYSNHKYDTGDYFSIDPMFGDEIILSALCKEAKKYGINIILDGVFSHTGADSIYFNKYGKYNSLGAYQSEKSAYYGWYTFNKWNEDYASWWGIPTLPTLNKYSKNYIDFIMGENGVLKYWQKKGIKGWRLDVADELPDNFLELLRTSVKEQDNESFIVGEVWEDASNKFSYGILKEYFLGNQLDSVTNYPLKYAIIEYIKTGNCNTLNYTLKLIIEKYPPQTVNSLMNILGTHDTERILTVLGTAKAPEAKKERAEHKLSSEEKKNTMPLLKIASLLQFTLPGIPCIYYGDEAGLEGFEDPFNRRCYPWENEDTEILNHYKMLSELRKNKVFSDGKYKCLLHEDGIFIFERYNDNERIIIATNLSKDTVTLNFKQKFKKYLTRETNFTFNLSNNEYLILLSNIEPNNLI